MVTVSLSVRPLTVKVTGPRSAVSAGTRVTLTCESDGARPPALLSWWRRNQSVHEFAKSEPETNSIGTGSAASDDSSAWKAESSLQVQATAAAHLQQFTCRADHPILPDSALEHSYTLHVNCKYRLSRIARHSQKTQTTICRLSFFFKFTRLVF
jgi:hypothetical protein